MQYPPLSVLTFEFHGLAQNAVGQRLDLYGRSAPSPLHRLINRRVPPETPLPIRFQIRTELLWSVILTVVRLVVLLVHYKSGVLLGLGPSQVSVELGVRQVGQRFQASVREDVPGLVDGVPGVSPGRALVGYGWDFDDWTGIYAFAVVVVGPTFCHSFVESRGGRIISNVWTRPGTSFI